MQAISKPAVQQEVQILDGIHIVDAAVEEVIVNAHHLLFISPTCIWLFKLQEHLIARAC